MKIALIQIGARAEKTDSLALATKYIAEAAQNGADFAVLPEMFNCPYQTANFPIYAEPEGGMCWQAMSDAAREHHIYLVAGSMPEKDEAGHVYNTAYAFDREGKQIGKHPERKVHGERRGCFFYQADAQQPQGNGEFCPAVVPAKH